MEEVKEFRYLGFMLQRNGSQEAHVKEREKSGSSNRTGMGDRKKKIWKGLGKKTMTV